MKSTSTDSRYSPCASAIAVPPPNRQRLFSSSSASRPSSTRAMRRWCGRSNKQHSLADGGRQVGEQRTLGRVHRVAVDVAPVALVQRERLFGTEFHHGGIELPGDLAQLREVAQADACMPRGPAARAGGAAPAAAASALRRRRRRALRSRSPHSASKRVWASGKGVGLAGMYRILYQNADIA